MDIEWEDPPGIERGRRGRFEGVGQQLKANPGKWARLVDYNKTTDDGFKSSPNARASTAAQTVKRARTAEFRPEGAFEARAVQGVLYARYVQR